MKNISLKRNINFDKNKDINDYELFSLTNSFLYILGKLINS